MKTVLKLYRYVNLTIERLFYVLIVLMTCVTIYRVIMRFFFNFTPSWSEELSCIMMIWLTFIGLTIGVREKLHLNIVIFYNRFSNTTKLVFDWVVKVVYLIFAILLITKGLDITIQQARATMCVVKIFPFSNELMPNSIIYIPLPLSGFFILLYTLIDIFDRKNIFKLDTLKTKEY